LSEAANWVFDQLRGQNIYPAEADKEIKTEDYTDPTENAVPSEDKVSLLEEFFAAAAKVPPKSKSPCLIHSGIKYFSPAVH
jgi:hypothetical protein